MTAAVALKAVAETPARPDFDEARLAWLQQSVQANRFLPEPTIDSIFVGDGDYRAIGSEFLGHLVRLGGILPDDRVLTWHTTLRAITLGEVTATWERLGWRADALQPEQSGHFQPLVVARRA